LVHDADHCNSDPTPVCVALDVYTEAEALRLVKELEDITPYFKVGPPLLLGAGPLVIKQMTDRGLKVFLDLKFHDTPATVYSSVLQASELRPWLIDVHALAGPRALQKAVEAAGQCTAEHRPQLVAVTLLVSHGKHDLPYDLDCDALLEEVLRLASMAKSAGLDGVVCSAAEAPAVRNAFGPDFLIVTPGVRFSPASRDEYPSERIATFGDSTLHSSSLIVVGRPIITAASPRAALKRAVSQVAQRSK